MNSVQTVLALWTEQPIDELSQSTRFRIESETGRLDVAQVNIPSRQLKGWDGYYLGLSGLKIDRPSDDAPWWQLTFDDDNTVTIKTHTQTAFKAGAPLFAQVLWTPENGVEKSLVVRRDTWDDNDLADAARALKLLHGTAGAGRPFGSREDDPEPDFPEWYAETYWRLFSLNRKRPSQIEIARDRGISADTLARRRDHYHVPRVPSRPPADNR